MFEASAFAHALTGRPSRWVGWRLRLLVLAVLAVCLGLLAAVQLLIRAPALDAQWQSGPLGELLLHSSATPALQPHIGRRLLRLQAGSDTLEATGALLGAPRWTVHDDRRADVVAGRSALNQLFTHAHITLHFDDGHAATVPVRPRGLGGLGLGFWLLALPALSLAVVGAVVPLARPTASNLLYALMAVCQAASLLWIGAESGVAMGPLPAWLVNDLPWRLALDLTAAAAAVHACAFYPRRVAACRAVSVAGWLLSALMLGALAADALPHAWWWGQGSVLALGMAAIGVLARSYAEQRNPFAMVLRRFGYAALGMMVVVDGALVAAAWRPELAQDIANWAVMAWSLCFALLMALVPFLSRAPRLLRELALLAGLATVATSLNLLFITLFSLEPNASLTLAVFIALAAYAGTRQWMLDQMVGNRAMTAERTFEPLYRVAREVQKDPSRSPALLTQLLRDLFDPLEVLHVPTAGLRARVLADGSALVVPVLGAADLEPLSLVVRFARRGLRIFTREDAQLTDRIVDQLRSAVAYDEAVERGRAEERQRIAQDLHDDIGARLLTLMYRTQDPEIEDYLGHTLKDLKTLTRGLAAADHRLSHSVAEWKADIQQRLGAADVGLAWSFAFDEDPELGVVQWSALTRVLRELVSNALHHARATHVAVAVTLAGGSLQLTVADDGTGRNPKAWTHGLGLGGVRKRVKQRGGDVAWRENSAQGIVCEVRIPHLSRRA